MLFSNKVSKILLILVLGIIAAGLQAADRPNVLFIAVDDLRPELATYGAPVKTPNLDKLAATGIRFDRAYCQQAVCGASRLSIMGGLYPTKTKEQSFHVTGWRERYPDLLTMNQHFRAEGYETVGLGKIYHGSSGAGVDPGNWDEWIKTSGKQYALEESMAEAKRRRRANPDRDPKDFRGTTTEMGDVADEVYTDGARALVAVDRLLDLASKEKPFFFAVGFTKPHLPFVAPRKYWDLYERSDFAMPENLGFPDGYPEEARNVKAGEMSKYSDYEGKSPRDFSNDLNQRLIHGYAACVSYMDANVGKVLDALEQSGEADQTIVVFWGDHGWKLGDHFSWCKHTNFEVDTRVPLMMRVPGLESGREVSEPVELIDLYPTLCELTGIPIPGHLQGVSLAPFLKGESKEHRASAYSAYPHRKLIGHSIRMDAYRYTEWYEKSSDKLAARVLTNLEEDPGEQTNVAGEPGLAADLLQVQKELRFRIKEAIR